MLIATVFIDTMGNWLEYGKPCAGDYIAVREGYVVGFNLKTHCPDWVVERVTKQKLSGQKVGRSEDFRADGGIPTSALLEDYKCSGWSCGQMCPGADCKWSPWGTAAAVWTEEGAGPTTVNEMAFMV